MPQLGASVRELPELQAPSGAFQSSFALATAAITLIGAAAAARSRSRSRVAMKANTNVIWSRGWGRNNTRRDKVLSMSVPELWRWNVVNGRATDTTGLEYIGAQSPAELMNRPRNIGQEATTQQIPVVDLENNKIGEENLKFWTISKKTANYVVQRVYRVWRFQQKPFTNFAPTRGDFGKGNKPWKQKGSGRARVGSKWNPLWGTTVTNKAPRGLDKKARKKTARLIHLKAISTVLQSKWKRMKIVQGLEDWSEPRVKPLIKMLNEMTGTTVGQEPILIITRQAYGERSPQTDKPFPWYRDGNPLYMSGWQLPFVEFRRPRDIDPLSDALFQSLTARHVIISREAFFDLCAKFNAADGWAFQTYDQILMKSFQELAKEFPYNREAEIEAARGLPHDEERREFWAMEQRKEMGIQDVQEGIDVYEKEAKDRVLAMGGMREGGSKVKKFPPPTKSWQERQRKWPNGPWEPGLKRKGPLSWGRQMISVGFGVNQERGMDIASWEWDDYVPVLSEKQRQDKMASKTRAGLNKYQEHWKETAKW